MSVWEWIHDELFLLGHSDLSEQAGEIADLVKKLYPEDNTLFPELSALFTRITRRLQDISPAAALVFIDEIADDTNLCVTCVDAKRRAGSYGLGCNVCLLAKEAGGCFDPDSLYDSFTVKLRDRIQAARGQKQKGRET